MSDTGLERTRSSGNTKSRVPASANEQSKLFANSVDVAIAIGVVGVIIMIIIPMPSILLDVLLALNLTSSILILLIVLYTKKATDFSVFPTLLLIITVIGLALNISTTRQILSLGVNFDVKLIKAFASFVVGAGGTDGIVIGAIIFIVLIVVQVLVITKGATRISEVAARFTLDALPGKQMSIDAQYNSGTLSEAEAMQQKLQVQKEVDFYGQMDGATKFVSGNVKAGIFITFINLIGGLAIGMALHNESFTIAISTYTQLTIGDGLLSQLPAFFVSIATGLIVTRANSDNTFGADLTHQFSLNSKVYIIGAVFLAILSFLPGFPWYVLLPLAGLMFFLGTRLRRRQSQSSVQSQTQSEGAAKPESEKELSPLVPLEPISLEIGLGLVPLAQENDGQDLLQRITRIRKEVALDMGLVIPRLRIMDNMRLEPSGYCYKLKGLQVGSGNIRLGYYLAINSGTATEEIPGEKTRDPAFDLPAIWISEEQRERAERAGYTIVDACSILATHLTDIIKRHAAEILGRQEVQAILDAMKKEYPTIVEEALKNPGLGLLYKVLQKLLQEQVSIRNMVAIVETLMDYAPLTKDLEFLTNKVRQALGRQICLRYSDDKKVLHAIVIEPTLLQKIKDSKDTSLGRVVSALEPSLKRNWIRALSKPALAAAEQKWNLVLLCGEAEREVVRSSIEIEFPDLAVLAYSEVSNEFRMEVAAEIRIDA